MIEPAHYHGEDIVSENSFLRRLPNILEAEQRMRLDALVFSADMLQHAWITLVQVATSLGSGREGAIRRERALLFAAAWSIVDHLNAARQLLQSLPHEGEEGPRWKALMQALEPARKLRNQMDHLTQKIGNLAKQKGRRSAIFGTLSYFLAGDMALANGHAILIQSGLVHGQETWNVVNPAGRTIAPPADLFTLSAFGENFELGPPIAALADWLATTSKSIESQAGNAVKALAAQTGHSTEQLLAHSGAGYFLALAINFDAGEVNRSPDGPSRNLSPAPRAN